MSNNEITIILALTDKPQKETKVLDKITLDVPPPFTQKSALFDMLEYLEMGRDLVRGFTVCSSDTAKWQLSVKGVKKQAELKKKGWYLG